MASEIMETTRLFARTCARLDPLWALELGAHIVRVAHSEPFWNETGGRVMVKQRTRLYGLELESRAVSYGKIDPGHATEIFIREGLVNDTVTFPLDFILHNRGVREKLEDLLTRARDSGYLNLDESAFRFYAARLSPDHGGPAAGVSSVGELVDLVRERKGSEPRFLTMAPEDLRDPDTIAHDADAFPAALPLENLAMPLNYAYKPGQADDGVTLEVGVREAESLTPAALDWAVKMDKPFFVGQRSLAILKKRGPRQKLVGFALAPGATVVPKECHLVIIDGAIKGRVTSIGFSEALGHHVGLALVAPDITADGTALPIRVGTDYAAARIVPLPFYDPAGDRQKLPD
jgi:HrpA-like RNA helicase